MKEKIAATWTHIKGFFTQYKVEIAATVAFFIFIQIMT